MLSSYNENITLDKYDFNVAYDDEFDMGTIDEIILKNAQLLKMILIQESLPWTMRATLRCPDSS